MKGGRLFKICIIAFLSVFFIYQIFAALNNPLTTVSATYYETYKGIDAEALLIRDETVITSDLAGVKRYTLSNGERVSKGGVIADVYANESISNTYSQLDELNTQLKSLESLALYNDGGSDVKAISEKIDTKISEYNEACRNGRFEEADQLQAELFALMSSKQSLVNGGNSGVDNVISSIKTQIASLQASVPDSNQTIKAGVAGYFVNEADGYETVLKTDAIDALTPEKFESIKPVEVASNVVGKIVSDYTWYLAVLISADDALKLKEGDSYSILTSQNTNAELSVSLTALNSSDNSNKTVAIFSCNSTDGIFSTIRNMPITIVLESYKGIRLNNSCVRMVDGELGVYVVQSGIVKFKKINALYTTDTYTICELDKNGNADSLRLYDEVVEKGKNLYDGKTIN